MDLFSTLTLALGSAWTSGINLYATVSVLGLLQKFSQIKLPGGLEVLDNWWIIGIAGGLALSSHGTKAALRAGANLSPEPVSNWILSIVEDIIAFLGTIAAVFAPFVIAIVLVIFLIFFAWFFPKVIRAIIRLFKGIKSLFRGEGFKEAARKAG